MDMLQLSLVFAVGAVSTFFFVASGGVGLVTLPALILMGLSPHVAIATDLFALLGGRLGGMIGLAKAGKLDYKLALKLSVVTAIGAVAGAFTLLSIDEQLMKQILGVFLFVMLGFLVFKPKIGIQSGAPSSLAIGICFVLFVLVGFWGTLVAAGFLSLGSAILLFVMHRSFIESAAILTVVGFVVGLVALVVYSAHGTINWEVGFALLAGKLIGGLFGAKFAIRIGDEWIRRIFMVVVTISVIKMMLS